MSGRESVRLVALREIVERGTDKTFLISTLVSLVVIACVAVLPTARCSRSRTPPCGPLTRSTPS